MTASTFRPDIEGLRGLAVLLVVAYHAGVPGASGGFVGVDVFFVLSGYLITGIIAREIEATHSFDVGRFFTRRIRRLLPGAVLVIAATLLAASLLLSPTAQGNVARTALAAGAYFSNVFFARQAGNYFAPAAHTNPLLHMWSLSVEEQFYLAWPFLLWLGLRRSRTRCRVRWFVMLAGAASLLAAVRYTSVTPSAAFYLSPLRAWEFAAGALLALSPVTVRASRLWIAFGVLLGTGMVLGSAVYLSPEHAFPGAAAIPVVLGTVLLLAPGHVGGSTPPGLDSRPLRWLGALSYSWYLWHWPVLVFLRFFVPDASWPVTAIVGGLSLVPASLAYHFVENPLRYSDWLGRRVERSFAFGGLLMVVAVTSAFASEQHANSVAHSPTYIRVRTSRLSGPLVRMGCIASFPETDASGCSLGDTVGTKILLFGDSHATHWGGALLPLLGPNQWHLYVVAKSSCPAADVPVRRRPSLPRFRECDRWRTAALRRIREIHPDLVIISNSQGYVRVPGDIITDRNPILSWSDGLARSVAAIRSTGSRVLLLRDTPRMGFDVPECEAQRLLPIYRYRSCSQRRSVALDSAYWGAELAALRPFSGVTFADMTDAFCDRTDCRGDVGGTIMFRDGHHMSAAFAATLAPRLQTVIRHALAQ